MVCGEICETALVPEGEAGAVEVGVLPRPNVLADGWDELEDCEDEDEVNDCSASTAVEIAPRAMSMANSIQTPHESGSLGYRVWGEQAPCQR
jgi:hypothetical protein